VTSCQEFLDSVANRQCVEQFLALLPGGAKISLQGALTAFSAIAQAENYASFYFDKMLTKYIDDLDEDIAALLIVAQPFKTLIDDLAEVLLPFGTCPAVGTIITAAVAPVAEINNLIFNSSQRKKIMKNAAKKGTSKIMSAVFTQLPQPTITVGDSLQSLLDTFDGVRNCLGSVAQIDIPPISTIDKIADIVGGTP